MKKKFMNFLETLSRDEMRKITGGYGDNCQTCYDSAPQACSISCDGGTTCNVQECISNQEAECDRVLGC